MVRGLSKGKIQLIKTGFIIVISMVGIYLCVQLLNQFGTGLSHYVTAENSRINLTEMSSDYIYTVNFENSSEHSTYKKIILNSDKHNKSDKTLLLDYLKNPYHMYVNGELVSQNIDKTQQCYNPSLSYITYTLSDEVTHTVEIVGENLQFITWFIGDSEDVKSFVQIRVVVYTSIMMLYIGLAILCMVLFMFNTNKLYFLLLSIIGFVSALKIIILYEIHFISHLIHVTTSNFHMYNVFTSLLNMILPIFILGYLYDMKPKKRFLVLSLVIWLIVSYLCLDIQIYNKLFMVILATLTISGLVLQAYGIYHRKPYWFLMVINNIVYSSTGYYKSAMDSFKMPKSLIDGLFHITYVGATIYLFIFVSIFLIKYIAEVKALNKKKEEFDRVYLLRGISHDLKHPLAVIKSGNQIMEKYDLPRGDYLKYIKANLKANRQLENMVNNIGVYLNGKETDYKGNTNAREVIDNAIQQFTVFCEAANKVFTVHWQDDLNGLNIPLKPIVLYRILFNIFDNANKYSEEGTMISISIRKEDTLSIVFKDQGMGMPESQVEEVFQPFYRIDQSRSEEGLGLGLSVVKNILDNIEGSIGIKSQVGVGTEVQICVPYTESIPKTNLTM